MNTSEMLRRQSRVVQDLCAAYFSGKLDLNSLVQRIEGVVSVVELAEVSEKAYPSLALMEEINAVVIDEQRCLTEAEQAMVNESIGALLRVFSSIESLEKD